MGRSHSAAAPLQRGMTAFGAGYSQSYLKAQNFWLAGIVPAA
jgi:hypothetical protein